MRVTLIFLAACIGISACSRDLPEIDDTISKAAQDQPIPKLLQIDSFLEPGITDGSAIEEDTEALEARVLALKRKAAALRNRDIYDGQDNLRDL